MNKYLSTVLVVSTLISAPALFSMEGFFCMDRSEQTSQNTQKENPTSLAQIAREQDNDNPQSQIAGTPEKNTAPQNLHDQAALIANLIGQ